MNIYFVVLFGLVHSALGRSWSIPSSYEAVAAFHIPYIPFTEPLRVHFDADYQGGSQKFDFWNGANVLINSVSGPSFSVQPKDSILSCFNTTTCTNNAGTQYVNCSSPDAVPKGSLQHIFPNDLSLFIPTGKQIAITRCVKYVNQYKTGKPRADGGEYSDYNSRGGDPVCEKPFDSAPVLADEWAFDTKEGGKLDYKDNTTVGDVIYLGRYRFYTGPDGTPIQLRFVGHNIVLGGSHFDEYILDYLSIISTKVHPSVFNPPTGMYCPPKPGAVNGPTMKFSQQGSSHLEDYHMLMPEGQTARNDKFEEYNNKFSKTHSSESEKLFKRSHYHHSLRYVNSFNRQNKKYFLRVNHLSDQPQNKGKPGVKWTPEIATKFFSINDKKQAHKLSEEYVKAKTTSTLPYEVDWRQQHSLLPTKDGQRDNNSRGYFTNPAKDQGTCGSCWAFGAVGNLEGQLANLTRNDARGQRWPDELSEQNLMDCVWYAPSNPNNGAAACDGGQDWLAFEWMIHNNNGEIASASSYGPYMNQNGFCHFDKKRGMTNPVVIDGQTYKAQPGFAIQEWGITAVYACSPNCTQYIIANMTDDGVQNVLKSLKPESIDNLFDKVWHHGPLSVAIDATPPDFYYYGGGIYDNLVCTSYSLDHAVLVVGFGTDVDGSKYWIVKNSWSSSWGEDGYFRIAVDQNPCGVASTPMYVVMKN